MKTEKAPPPATVEEYLALLPEPQRAALEDLRRMIKAEVPYATEAIGYGMPGFKYKGKHLASIGAWKKHLALYGLNAEIAREFQGVEVDNGTIRFTPEKPLPPELVKRLFQARVAEINFEIQAKKK